MYYRIITNKKTYVTTDNVALYLNCLDDWIRITTIEGATVHINLSTVQVIEASADNVKEPSELEQIVGFTLNGLLGRNETPDTIKIEDDDDVH